MIFGFVKRDRSVPTQGLSNKIYNEVTHSFNVCNYNVMYIKCAFKLKYRATVDVQFQGKDGLFQERTNRRTFTSQSRQIRRKKKSKSDILVVCLFIFSTCLV